MLGKYDLDTKLQAAIAYLMTGSSEEAGRLCNIPGRTIRDWMYSSWWEDLVREAQTVKQKELDAIWTSLIHKVADKLRDRIDGGDCQLTRDGKLVAIPIKAKDLAFIMSVVTDKRALMRGQATSRKETVSLDQKLQKLQEGFKKITVTEEQEHIEHTEH